MKRTFCDVEGCKNEVLSPYEKSLVLLESKLPLKDDDNRRKKRHGVGSLNVEEVLDYEKEPTGRVLDVCLGCKVKLLRQVLQLHEKAADAPGIKQLPIPNE